MGAEGVPGEHTTRSEDETRALARRFAQTLRAGDVVALSGPLGAGKTRFVAGMAEGLGIETSRVSSPTYVLVHEYPTDDAGARERGIHALLHLDVYRVEGSVAIDAMGVEEGDMARAITVIEWADMMESVEAEYAVRIDHRDDGQVRRIAISRIALGD